ncbi:MAG: glycosyltransferase family A protein [Oceanococcaceae bacterium]
MDDLTLLGYRLLVGLRLPARWFFGDPLRGVVPQAREGRLTVEVVSHCWGYAHLLDYQLSSLVRHPPQNVDLTMTVYYCDDDEVTRASLRFFAAHTVPNVRWNWRALPRQQLFRRSIGRNDAARRTTADWIWFTDCDLLFGPGCLDSLGEALQGRTDRLVFPDCEQLTDLLPDDHPALSKDATPRLVDVENIAFLPHRPTRATGPLQIVHGDVARAAGYCEQNRYFMQPVSSWAKSYEDRVFRWMIRSQGVPISVPGVHRIRHQSKGRYKAGLDSELRKAIRKATDHRRAP